ncbi:unnamed protein product, partial [marine sediment metagenome]
MKTKTYLTIVLTILVAQLLTACTGNTALRDEAVSLAEPAAEELVNVEVLQPEDPVIEDADSEDDTAEETLRPVGWSEDTHSKDAEPDYEVVFPQDEVNRLDITITTETWQTLLADMTSLYGEFGSNPGRATGAGEAASGRQNPPSTGEQPIQNNEQVPERSGRPPGGGDM